MSDTTELVGRSHKIADACRRDDGSDIPLGEHLREMACTIERLTRERETTARYHYEMVLVAEARVAKLEAALISADKATFANRKPGAIIDRVRQIIRAALEDSK